MRWPLLLLLVGCRQIFGIDDPHARATDAPLADAAPDDAAIDAAPLFFDASIDCTMPPPAPADPLDESDNGGLTTLTIKNFKTGQTGSKFIVATAGDMFTVKFDQTWLDSSCVTNCIDQIEIGYIPGDRVGCSFDGQVPRASQFNGSSMFTLTAPAMLGWTSIRIAIGQNTGCNANGAHTWYEGPPAAADIAGYVCVH